MFDQLLKTYTEEETITEAARFGNAELSETLKSIDRFRFGIEYELSINNVDRNAPPPIDFASFQRDLTQVSVGLSKINSFGRLTIKENIADMMSVLSGSADEDTTRYVLEDEIPDTAALCTEMFNRVITSSDNIKKSYTGQVLYTHGLCNVVTNQEKEAIRLAKRFNIPQQKNTTIISTCIMALKAILRYLEQNAMYQEDQTNKDAIFNKMMQRFEREEERFGVGSPVGYVKKHLAISPNFLEDVVIDATVPDGAEVITRPLPLRDTFAVMEYMSDFIKKHGYTSEHTGLHVNISFKGISPETINIAKMVLLLDNDFMQGLSKSANNKNIFKYPVRNAWVTPVTQIFNSGSSVAFLAKLYRNGGMKQMLSAFESIFTTTKKETSISIKALFNANINQRRVEFRFFGGKGYENRTKEMQRDIIQVCYVMLAASDPDFLRKKYLEEVYRFVDKASYEHFDMSFSELIKQVP